VNEGGTATFTFVASSVNPNAAITVKYSISGSGGLPGKYYILSAPYGQVTIPAGRSTATLTLTALLTKLTTGHQDVNMNLNSGTGYVVSGVNTVHARINNVYSPTGTPTPTLSPTSSATPTPTPTPSLTTSSTATPTPTPRPRWEG
jgi:hypothetical protein